MKSHRKLKPGRKPLPVAEKLERINVSFHVPTLKKAIYRAHAEVENGLSISELVRLLIASYADGRITAFVRNS